MDLINHFGDGICECGKSHETTVKDVIIENGAIRKIPEYVKKYNGKKVFVLADVNTYSAAGKAVCDVLESADISYSKYVLADKELKPDEKTVGSVVMYYDCECDLIIGVGSGVINDTAKIIAKMADVPYFIVGTAPSMDGYASATSSMARDGLKVSLSTKCADVIIGDIDILKNAPEKMLSAGLGDMLAKYVSICEWRIAHIITGEYYCEKIAELIRGALKKCVDNADGLLKRDENAIKAVFEGLVIGGVAMAYAGISRPASGVEHYLAHIWDMRSLSKGTKEDLHGIECAIGTFISAQMYDKLKQIKPDKEKALKCVSEFDFNEWSMELKEFMGSAADTMLAQEAKEQKYNKEKHAKRIDVIIKNWDKIIDIVNEELPPAEEIEKLLNKIGAPKMPAEIGIDNDVIPMTFKASRDVRYKYILSHLAWDLGITDEII